MADDKYKQELFTAFYQVFTIFGFTPDTKQLERIKQATDNVAKVMQKQIEADTIVVVRRLQVALDKAFKATYKDLVAQEKRIKKLERVAHEQKDISHFKDQLKELGEQTDGSCSCRCGNGECGASVSKSEGPQDPA
jgi:hypothetical protein